MRAAVIALKIGSTNNKPSQNTSKTNNKITFKGNKTQSFREIAQTFIEEEALPFLEKHKSFTDENRQINAQADKMGSFFKAKFWYGDSFNKEKEAKAIIEQTDFIANDLARPIKYQENINEYNYLFRKSRKHFADEESRKCAIDVRNSIIVPNRKIILFKPIVNSYFKMKKDIQNGLANITVGKVLPTTNNKVSALNKASSITLFNRHFTNSVSLATKRLQEFLEKEKSSAEEIEHFQSKINDIKGWMAGQEKHLPEMNQRLDKAKVLVKNNSLPEDETVEGVKEIKGKIQKITKRNIQRLRKKFEANPRYKWNDKDNEAIDAILAQQKQGNEKLWHTIEASKQNFHSQQDYDFID